MSDHDDLRAIVQRYSRAADDRDVEQLAELFEPGAEIIGTRGTQTLDEWLATMRGPRAFPTSMHVLGDPLIELDADAGTATLDTYAVVYQLRDPDSGGGDLTLGIRYLDEVARTDGRWRIRQRPSRTLWMR